MKMKKGTVGKEERHKYAGKETGKKLNHCPSLYVV